MNTHDELAERLGQTLRGRVDQMADAPLTLRGVQGRARRIRRNRRHASGAGVAAALAILVPTAMLAGNPLDRAGEPLPATVVPTPAPVAEPVPLAPDSPAGEAPRIAWTEGHDVHLPDGTTLTTERAYTAAHLVTGSVLGYWIDQDNGHTFLDELAADGSVTHSTPIHTQVATNSDGSSLARVTADGNLEIVTEGAVIGLAPDMDAALPVSVEGAGGCPDGCAVWFNYATARGGAGRVGPDGTVTRPLPDVLTVSDVHDDRLVAAMTEVNELEPGSCSAVYDGTDALWDTCDHSLGDFSPDGRFIIGTDAYLDGAGQSELVLLDAATGDRIVEFDSVDGLVVDRVWEDTSHVLVVHHSYADGMWRLFRVGLDGSVEQAAEPVTAPDFDGSPYGLGAS
jgi:hypothetical protein